jgi:hypothetical protein
MSANPDAITYPATATPASGLGSPLPHLRPGLGSPQQRPHARKRPDHGTAASKGVACCGGAWADAGRAPALDGVADAADLGAAVVPVLAHLGDEDARAAALALLEGFCSALHRHDRLVRLAVLAAVRTYSE